MRALSLLFLAGCLASAGFAQKTTVAPKWTYELHDKRVRKAVHTGDYVVVVGQERLVCLRANTGEKVLDQPLPNAKPPAYYVESLPRRLFAEVVDGKLFLNYDLSGDIDVVDMRSGALIKRIGFAGFLVGGMKRLGGQIVVCLRTGPTEHAELRVLNPIDLLVANGVPPALAKQVKGPFLEFQEEFFAVRNQGMDVAFFQHVRLGDVAPKDTRLDNPIEPSWGRTLFRFSPELVLSVGAEDRHDYGGFTMDIADQRKFVSMWRVESAFGEQRIWSFDSRATLGSPIANVVEAIRVPEGVLLSTYQNTFLLDADGLYRKVAVVWGMFSSGGQVYAVRDGKTSDELLLYRKGAFQRVGFLSKAVEPQLLPLSEGLLRVYQARKGPLILEYFKPSAR